MIPSQGTVVVNVDIVLRKSEYNDISEGRSSYKPHLLSAVQCNLYEINSVTEETGEEIEPRVI